MKQRDQYKLIVPKDIKDASNAEIALTDISSIEFSVGGMTKVYDGVSGEVTYDPANTRFEFPVTEEETASFHVGRVRCQMRVHFTDGDIIASDVVLVDVGECIIEVT